MFECACAHVNVEFKFEFKFDHRWVSARSKMITDESVNLDLATVVACGQRRPLDILLHIGSFGLLRNF